MWERDGKKHLERRSGRYLGFFNKYFYVTVKNTGVGCHFLLQGISLTQGSNPGLLHCRQILYQLSYEESPINGLTFGQSAAPGTHPRQERDEGQGALSMAPSLLRSRELAWPLTHLSRVLSHQVLGTILTSCYLSLRVEITSYCINLPFSIPTFYPHLQKQH